MSQVFVLDTNKHPLDPVHPARARILLKKGGAVVFKRYPFTILVKTDREHRQPSDYRVKIDPGSKTTGIALVNDASGQVVPITAISLELVKFDTQLLDNPDIAGLEYQQGELQGYEVREYLLEKWGRACTYCQKKELPLQVEHIVPRAKGGTNRISNLCLACEKCNRAKGP